MRAAARPCRSGAAREGLGEGVEPRKHFRNFADDETGGERLIGGALRHGPAFLPPGLQRPDRLLVVNEDASVAAFRAAAHGREIVIEVGSGKGLFATGLGAARSGVVVLAVETRLGFCLATLKRAAAAGADNVFSAWGDARVVIPAFVPEGAAAEAYLLFPDPWWKRRHAGRRHGPAMIAAIATALRPEGRLVIKSDVPEYLALLVDTVRGAGLFQPVPVPPDLPLTDRERRLQSTGTEVFAAAFARR